MPDDSIPSADKLRAIKQQIPSLVREALNHTQAKVVNGAIQDLCLKPGEVMCKVCLTIFKPIQVVTADATIAEKYKSVCTDCRARLSAGETALINRLNREYIFLELIDGEHVPSNIKALRGEIVTVMPETIQKLRERYASQKN